MMGGGSSSVENVEGRRNVVVVPEAMAFANGGESTGNQSQWLRANVVP